MEELSEIINLDQLIQDKKRQIQNEQTVLSVLEIQREKLAGKFLEAMETDRFEHNGVVWKKQKGRASVQLKPHITVEALPDFLVKKSPDKVAILQASKQHPELVETFADIHYSPEKLTYKVI